MASKSPRPHVHVGQEPLVAQPGVEPLAPARTELPTVSELKGALKASKADWTVNPNLKSRGTLPRYGLGAIRADIPAAAAVPPVDFSRLMSSPPTNPHLLARAVELKLVDPEVARALEPPRTWTIPSEPPKTPKPRQAAKARKPAKRPRKDSK